MAIDALYFDAVGGAAGDMIVGALLDLGLPGLDLAWLQGGLASLSLGGYELACDRVMRHAVSAAKFRVLFEGVSHEHAAHDHHHHDDHDHHHHHHADEHHHDGGHHEHRRHRDIVTMIRAAGLPSGARDLALRIFALLAEAEATVHRVPVDDVAFHEVGAVDSIVDIVGAALCLDRLGLPRCFASPLPNAAGTVTAQHGRLPLPAPATALLLRGIPLVPSLAPGERVTPTGAAILRAIVSEWGAFPLPSLSPAIIESVGYGAGDRDDREVPNFVRVLACRTASTRVGVEPLVLMETNLDDATPELLGHVLEGAMSTGALDAWIAPIVGKKGRPAQLLSLLCQPADHSRLESYLLSETTTLGVRSQTVSRRALERREMTATTPWGPIRVKVARRPDGRETGHPEYADVAEAARRAEVPFQRVTDAALRDFEHRGTNGGSAS